MLWPVVYLHLHKVSPWELGFLLLSVLSVVLWAGPWARLSLPLVQFSASCNFETRVFSPLDSMYLPCALAQVQLAAWC